MNPARPAKRLQGDGGAALIEGALVAMPFFILIFGMLDFGILMKDYLSLSNTTRVGVRSASVVANDANADYFILDAIKKASVGLNRTKIDRIVIWHASGEDDVPSNTCTTGSLSGTGGTGAPLYTGACNVYRPADFNYQAGDFDCDNATDGVVTPGVGPKDEAWCGPKRKVGVNPRFVGDGDGTDYIGVWVKYNFNFVTGLFGDGMELTEQVIHRIEPQGLNG